MKAFKIFHLCGFAVIGMIALLATPRAFAGAKYVYSMNIYTNAYGTIVQGSLADIRNSADTASYIGCEINYNQGVGNTGTCYAYKADTNQYAYCSTTDPAATQAIASIKGDSFIQF